MNKFLVLDPTLNSISKIENDLVGLTDDAFFKDGSKSMTGDILLGANSLAGGINIVLENQASATNPPVGQLKLFSKTDDKLYIRNDTGTEIDLTSGGITSIDTTGSVNGITLSGGPIITSGTITLGGSLSINNSDWLGNDLSIGNGGSGQSTAQLAINALTNVSGASDDEVLIKAGSGDAVWSETVKSVSTSGTVNGISLTGGPITTTGTIALGGNLSVNNSDWSGTDLSLANGGTGESTAQGAINSLTNVSGATVGKILTKVGLNAVFSNDIPYLRVDDLETGTNSNTISDSSGTTFLACRNAGNLSRSMLCFGVGAGASWSVNQPIDGHNIAIGYNAMNLTSQLNSYDNIAIGTRSLENSSGVGVQANIAIGTEALSQVVDEDNSIAIGYRSQQNTNPTTNAPNVSLGSFSLANGTDLRSNTAIGYNSLRYLSTTATGNIGLGYGSGKIYNSTESYNICIGNNGVLGDNNTIRIGSVQSNTFIKGIFNTNALSTWVPVRVSFNGELGINQYGYASYYFAGNSTATNGTVNIYSVISGTRVANLSTSNFTVDTATPDIEYIGTEDVICRISVSANWQNEDNSNNFCRIGVHKNGVIQNNLEQRSNLSINSDYPRNVSLSGFLALQTNDKVDVRVLNSESSSDDILVSYFNLNIEII